MRVFRQLLSLNVYSIFSSLGLMAEYAIRVRGYKTFSMLTSAEFELLNAHKYKNIEKFCFFLPKMLFFLLKHVKMSTIVGILTFMSRRQNSCSAELSMKKAL